MRKIEVVDTGPDLLRLRAEFAGTTADELFGWWTRPELLTRFWSDSAEVEGSVGGCYELGWDGPGWVLRGRYTSFEPAALSFTWNWDHEPAIAERRVTLEFRDRDSVTELTITHQAYGPGDEAERQGHAEGWEHFCGRLGLCLAED